MAIKVSTVDEREVTWQPKGYGSSNEQIAVIRNGMITHLSRVDSRLIEADIDGYIEFIQAIKKAIDETV